MNYKMISINVGKPKTLGYRERKELSGIYKEPIKAPAFLSFLNLEGDKQADLKHHGGVDKAVCGYCYDHYSFWKQKLNIAMPPGFFGENLTIKGLTEDIVAIGDIFKLGDALLQVSQPRIPCYKTSAKSGIDDLQQQMIETGFTGFYFRVLKEGRVSPHDDFILIEKASNSLSIQYLNSIFYNGRDHQEAVAKIKSLKALAPRWLDSLLK